MRRSVLAAALLAVPVASQPVPFAFGGPQADLASAIDVAPDGLFAIGGETAGSYDPDPGPGDATVPNGGSIDGFAAVYDADGTFRFAIPIGPPGPSGVDDVFDVALGPSGELAVVGQAGRTVDLDPGPGTREVGGTSPSVFLAVYEPDGTLRWGFAGDFDFPQRGYAAFDGDGNVYLAVTVNAPVDLDPGPGEAVVDAGQGAALASYTPGGDFRWGFALDGNQLSARGIAVASGRVALAATLVTGAIDVDPGPGETIVDAGGIIDWVAATYSSADGSLESAFAVGASGPRGAVSGIALGDDGSLAIVGTIDRDADFDPGAGEVLVADTGGSDGTGAVAVYASDGSLRFAYGLGSTRVRGVDLADGRVVWTGYFDDPFDADPGAAEVLVDPVRGFDIVTVSLSASGAFEWASAITGDGTGDNGLGVGLSGDRAVVTGQFSDTVDADPGAGSVLLSSRSRSDFDVFVVAYGATGELAARPTSGRPAPPGALQLAVTPNPAAASAVVRLRGAAEARIEAFDALGRRVAVLHEGPAGDGLTLRLPPLAPGVYTVRAVSGLEVRTVPVSIVR
ncbi:MAG: hypothetical protein AAGK21_03350 [Bacteroidota bacterium]